MQRGKNIRRMKSDNRDGERIKRGVEISRKAFADSDSPPLNISDLTVEEAAKAVIRRVGLHETTQIYEDSRQGNRLSYR